MIQDTFENYMDRQGLRVTIPDDPREMGVPHDTWRPSQRAALTRVVNLFLDTSGEKPFIFQELPTGSGKSPIAAALGSIDAVTVFVGTLGLLDQYHERYDFAIIKGRQNYLCSHPDKIDKWLSKGMNAPTASDCHYSPMTKCEYAGDCAYMLAKEEALASSRLAVTYPYAMLSAKVFNRRGFVVLDEAHEAIEQILRFAEFRVDSRILTKWGIMPNVVSFPFYRENTLITERTLEATKLWATDCIAIITKKLRSIDEQSREFSQGSKLIERFTRARGNLERGKWFLECDARNAELSLKALDARTASEQLWKNKSGILLMSATIGDPEAIAEGLGIERYSFDTYEHPIPPEYRPVLSIYDKRMTKTETDKNPRQFEEQALRIVAAINALDKNWRGLIVAPSLRKIGIIYTYLTRHLPERRIIAQVNGANITELIERFITDIEPGDIALLTIQGAGKGIDLRGDLARWVILAGCEFPNPTDAFTRARQKHGGATKYLWWTSYNGVVQAAGRVSRGERDENGEYLINYTFLADGSLITKRALKSYPSWFSSAITLRENQK